MEFSLHAYLGPLREKGASPDYIKALQRSARPLIQRQLPVILTLGHLAHLCNVPYGFLNDVVSRKVDPYRVFSIRKRSGRQRFICVPHAYLMRVQRWVHEEILCSATALGRLSPSAMAYRPDSGSTVADHVRNARQHLGASWILKLDISGFFESISERQVYRVFRELGYRAQVALCLTRLCTRVLPFRHECRTASRWKTTGGYDVFPVRRMGHLPQGAPTSPMLSNLVCTSLDSMLEEIAERELLTYTRYADDMVFSGDFDDRAGAIRVLRELARAVSKAGFRINQQKTSIAKNGGRKIVTGLSVEDSRLRLPRQYKDKLRQELYYLAKFGIVEHCAKLKQPNSLAYLLRLAGRIRYLRSVEHALGQSMLDQLVKLYPVLEETERLLSTAV